mmetsp:Transcript_19835/g.37322  ORF Transcript_19835/g.37322 Transcript_19835/m.37322 type:complete len:305 (+) Transcript_19835:370-1284(+)
MGPPTSFGGTFRMHKRSGVRPSLSTLLTTSARMESCGASWPQPPVDTNLARWVTLGHRCCIAAWSTCCPSWSARQITTALPRLSQRASTRKARPAWPSPRAREPLAALVGTLKQRSPSMRPLLPLPEGNRGLARFSQSFTLQRSSPRPRAPACGRSKIRGAVPGANASRGEGSLEAGSTRKAKLRFGPSSLATEPTGWCRGPQRTSQESSVPRRASAAWPSSASSSTLIRTWESALADAELFSAAPEARTCCGTYMGTISCELRTHDRHPHTQARCNCSDDGCTLTLRLSARPLKVMLQAASPG